MKILITGGAGFVGSSLAKLYKQQDSTAQITVLDNLKRRGSELNLPAFKELGVEFAHGDVRSPGDLAALNGNFDILVEASAEPSVLAGISGSADYLLQTNLVGTMNCLEFARQRTGGMIFLSTSRVYSIAPIRALPLKETASRFEIKEAGPGFTPDGLTEEFTTSKARSLYGATKLASEMIIQEYQDTYKLPCVINRCGVIAGPGQFGKVDQGVFTLWVANHYFGKSLKYTGFGGAGKQVRDLLHPRDLFEALGKQVEKISSWSADVYNLGGSRGVSTSMLEFTAICEKVCGKKIAIASNPETNPVDIPLYLTDHSKATRELGWRPRVSVEEIVKETHAWIRDNEATLRPLFA